MKGIIVMAIGVALGVVAATFINKALNKA